MGWRGLTQCVQGHKKQVDPKNKTIFVIENYIEDFQQDEKSVPDLLESIMRHPGLVEEELRPILFKLSQFGLRISKIKVSTFWTPEI